MCRKFEIKMKLIKISAMWCPSCLIMHDMMDEILKEHNFEVISYDYDFNYTHKLFWSFIT